MISTILKGVMFFIPVDVVFFVEMKHPPGQLQRPLIEKIRGWYVVVASFRIGPMKELLILETTKAISDYLYISLGPENQH